MDKVNFKKAVLVSMPVIFAVALAITLAACMAQADRSLEDSILGTGAPEESVQVIAPTLSEELLPEFRSIGDGKCEVAGIGDGGAHLTVPAVSPKGETVVGIGDSAFLGLASLKSITLPESVTYIGAYAFYGSSLERIELHDGVAEIGECAFSNCRALTGIFVDSGNEKYTDMDGVLYSRDKSELICYPSGRQNSSFTLRSGVTVIHKMAFYGCEALKSLNFNGTEEEWARIRIAVGNDLLNVLSLSFPESDK